MSEQNTQQTVATGLLVHSAVQTYRDAGHVDDEDCVRRAVQVAIAQDTFRVGEEVTCAHGCMTGVILAIDGDTVQISWSCRGKTVEKLCDLDHLTVGQAS